MWKVSKGLFAITTLPLVVVGIIFIVLGVMADPSALTDDGYSLKNFFYLMGGAFVIFPLIGALGVFFYYKRINDREINLINNGIHAEAEILHREQTGTYINELPQVKFILSINHPELGLYEMEYKDVVSLLDMNSIVVGAKLPVLIDPNNEKNILLIYS